MSVMKRSISLLLCIVMLTSVLASCDTDNSHNHETDESKIEQPQGTTPDHTHDETTTKDETTETPEQHTHTPATAVTENLVDSTCTKTGSYDEVVYCSVCHEEISRTQKTVDKKAHDYSQKVTTDTYLKSSADCNNAAVYHFSCSCGAKGATTFTEGEANGHSYSSAWEKNATHHWHKATCEHTSEISGEAEHNYGTDNICDICEYDKTIHVSGVTLNFSSLTMTVDDVKTLVATIAPNNATNQSVTWTTSNASIVAVDTNGKITAVGVGTAVITATTADGNKTAQCTVVVSAKVCPHTTTRTERENEVDSTCGETGTYDEVVYCSACGDELSRTEKTIPKKNTHTNGTPVTENFVDSTCAEEGSYDEVVYCSICGHEISRTEKAIFKKNTHTSDSSLQENIVDSTCADEGSYDEVVYCSVCGIELSRVEKTIEKKTTHTEAGAVQENIVDSTCGETGSYDEVIYCSVCGKEIRRTEKTIEKKNTHTEGAPQQENYIDSTFEEKGSYDSVVYCTVCGKELSRNTVTIPEKTHTAGTAVVENKVDSTCKETGTYDEVVYCTECGEELSRVQKTIEKKTIHTEDEAVTENFVDSTCAEEGSYDEVVYCSVCDKELSRETKTISKKTTHTAGMAVQENFIDSTCNDEGTYDEVVYCSVCNYEISRTTKAIDKKDTHTESEPLQENYVDSTFDEKGSYDEVVYCTACGKELSRNTITIPEKTHTAGPAVVENKVDSTCGKTGTYDEVVYCTECGEELSRVQKVIEKKTTHTEGSAVEENRIEATCKDVGSYDEVVYCSVCDMELSRETKTIAKKATHIPATAVQENYVDSTCKLEGSYDEVIYCSICGIEMSREIKVIDKVDHTVVIDPYVESTCISNGLTEGSHCGICGTVLVEQISIPAAHKYSLSVYTDKSCISEALTTYTCSVCGDSYTCNVAPITANIQKTSYDITDGHFSSVRYTVTASGGVGDLSYRHILWRSRTDTTVLYNSGFVSSNTYEIYTKDGSSMDDYVWIITIKDNYGYAVHYYISVVDDACLRYEYAGTVTHNYENHICIDCQKEEPYEAIYDISANLDGSLVAKLYNNGNGTYELDITGSGNMTYSSCPWSIYDSLITKVNISEGVTSIGEYAFSDFVRLQSITIPNTVTSIGNYAFSDCSNLTSIIIPDKVTYIGNSAFSGCSALTNVTIGHGVKNIRDSAFYNCIALEYLYFNSIAMNDLSSNNTVFSYAGQNSNGIKVVFGAKVTNIPAYLFASIDGTSVPNVISVDFEKGSICTSIGTSAFYGCTSLVELQLPDSITGIGMSAFHGCTGLTTLTINAINIGDSAFYGCTSLVELQLPDSITGIGMSAFHGCTGLTTLTINAINIGDSAFYNCTALITLNIGETVVTIGEWAFYNCTALEIINFNSVTMNDLDSDARAFYYAGKNGNGIRVNVGANVRKIPAYLFSEYDLYAGSTETKISIVHFEENSICESIGEYSFNHCDYLTEINLPESLMSIGDKAFYYCVSLTDITIPYNITHIGEYAFARCSALENVHFNATAMEDVSAWDYVFSYIGENAQNLKVIIGANVTKIPESLFYSSLYISSVEFEQGSKCSVIGANAFQSSGIKTIIIPNSIAEIYDMAFYCDSLKNIYYCGAEKDWNNIDIYLGNDILSSATIYYYSADQIDGNYWHYVDGIPTEWNN